MSTKEEDRGSFGMNGVHKRRRGEERGNEAEEIHMKTKVQTLS